MNEKVIITPRTKVSQILESYPELEDLLIKTLPVFARLRNPVLRNTVARVTSLQQAAVIANVATEELINMLRLAVGQDHIEKLNEIKYVTQKPDWFDEKQFTQELDARPILAAGEQPVNQVLAVLNTMPSNAIYKLTAPFIPAPLIDKATSLGFNHWVDQQKDSLFVIYFCKTGENS
jgi:hypothetical protein